MAATWASPSAVQASARYVSAASHRDGRNRSRPSAASCVSSRLASASSPSSVSSAHQPRLPRTAALAPAGQDPGNGGEVCQPSLFAAEAEHLNSVHARGVTPGQQPAPLVRAPCQRLGLREAAVAERDRRAVVIGHMVHKRLCRALSGSEQRGDLMPGRVEIAEGDERRHPPGHRLGENLRVAQLASQLARLGQHGEDLLQRACPA